MFIKEVNQKLIIYDKNINDYQNIIAHKELLLNEQKNKLNIFEDNINNYQNLIAQNELLIKDLKSKLNIYNNALTDCKNINEQKDLELNELKNKLTIYQQDLNDQKNMIEQKESELNELQMKLSYITNNRYKQIFESEKICVHFIYKEKRINFSVTCFLNNTFAEIEEKFYQRFPELREKNNNFTVNGKPILRFKTLAENNIRNNIKIYLYFSIKIVKLKINNMYKSY